MTTVTVSEDTTGYDVGSAPLRQRAAVHRSAWRRTSRSETSPKRWGALAAKRAIDVLLSTVAILVAAPVMVAIAIAIRVQSPGAPLFGQVRVGRGGRGFRCWKFRSMHRGAEEILKSDPALYARYVANDFKLPCDEDPRITRIGRVLRKTSLDELPQLFNVLLGHMSLVGPRPVVPNEVVRCYGAMVAEYVAVRPGLTGPWQVSGRNDIRYPERAVLDADYVRSWTLRRDLSILVRTPVILVRKAGVA